MIHISKTIVILLTTLALPISALAQNSLRDSLSLAIDQLAYHPDSTDLRLKKAGWNLQLQQWQYALDEYNYILKRKPDDLAARFYRAYANEKLHRYKFARLDYQTVLTMAPGHFEALLGLALLNQREGHYTEAYDNINTLVSQHPDSAIVYAARGGIEYERQMYDLAEYDYGKAIELDPSSTDYRLNRANIRILLRRKEEARADLEALVRMGVPRASLMEYWNKCK